MYVRHVSVTDFRSWSGAELDLEPGPVVLLGANGQGKTNLIEAIGYVATLGSHRVATDAPLVRRGAQRAVVGAAVVADNRELRVEIEINANRANRARLNGTAQSRARDVLGALRRVLFAPEDLAIVRGDPSERRDFLDELVVARRPGLAGVKADYERVLRQRGALLKSAGFRSGGARSSTDRESVASTLDVWDAQLAGFGAQLLAARLATLEALRPWAVNAYAQVAGGAAQLSMRYASAMLDADAATPARAAPEAAPEAAAELTVPELEQSLLSALGESRRAELERGVNLVGPHRDDLDLGIGELPVRSYASHGEGWSVALALRLGSYELLRAEYPRGAEPVLVLDDVFAELDAARREHLARVAAKAEQCIVTAAVLADVPDELAGASVEVGDIAARRA